VTRLRALLACALLLGAGTSAPAQPGQAYDPASFGYDYWSITPDHLVRGGMDRLIGFLIGVPEVSPESVGGFLEHEIAPMFDFHYMARWSAGRYWRRLDADQRTRMGAMLERLFLDALAHNLGTYAQPLPRVDVFPARYSSATQAEVFTRVVGDGRVHTRIDFRFYRSRKGWRVFDVTANGISAVSYYRGYFRDLLRRQGPTALEP
jgi:phospholipid transport system substrate-binding protein